MSSRVASYSVRMRIAVAGTTISWLLAVVFFYLGWRTL